MDAIPYGKQHIDESDIEEVKSTLSSAWLTQGPKISQLENLIAAYTDAKYAVAVSSGTAALHLACLAAGLKNNDEAITTPMSFAATANAVVYANARPVFADIDYDSINISVEEIKNKLTSNTKAILPVHFSGLPCNISEIHQLAKERNLKIIEDGCHALGAEYKVDNNWHKIGSCRHSDMTVFSFHPVKHITTGEGGAITTNDFILYEKLCALRTHGIYKDAVTAEQGSWYYDMRDCGFNYRITDIQCALGISQFWKLDRFLIKRKAIAERYDRGFRDIQAFVKLPEINTENKKHAWHLYILRLKPSALISKRKQIFQELHDNNIRVQVHYIPIPWHSYYKKLGYVNDKITHAEKYYSECISLPMYYDFSEDQQNYVISTVQKIIIKYINA